MSNEFSNIIRPEPLEDAILRMIKECEVCAKDKKVEVFSEDAKRTYLCIANELKTILKGEYIIGWENTNNNVCWIPCEVKMPEDDEKYNGKKIIDVLITTDRGKVTKVQRINRHKDDYWYWSRIYGDPIAWMPLPKAYKLNGI